MVHYKLIYFDIMGRGEGIRQIFAAAGQQFEDVRIQREEWPALKPNTPFGQIPVLEIDGKQLGQSHTIERYLARQFGLAGKSAYEEALVDSIVDQYVDFVNEVMPYKRVVMGFAQGDKDKLYNETYVPAIKKHLPHFVKFLKQNKSGYLVGDSLTWADIILAHGISTTEKSDPELLNDFPETKAHAHKIHELPKLKEYLANRPERPF